MGVAFANLIRESKTKASLLERLELFVYNYHVRLISHSVIMRGV